MTKVLLLNATYEPLSFVSLRRAVVLLLKQKAEVLEAGVERHLRAEQQTLPFPLVIRLLSYVRVPHRSTVSLSRRTLLCRDNYTCQYCGTTEQPLTIDHVLPRSKGGKTEWTNVVAACGSCNRRKANRLPTEARMTLRSKPIKPGYIAVALLGQAKGNEVWERYIQP
jgi:5-methylcytosine-specific restriction endonuclease McrA